MNKRKKQEEARRAEPAPPRHGGFLGWLESLSLDAAGSIPFPRARLWVQAYFQPAFVQEKEGAKASYAQMAIDLLLAGALTSAITLLQYLAISASSQGGGLSQLPAPAQLIAFLVLAPAALVLSSFFNFALFFVLAKLLGGRGSFKQHSGMLSLIFCGSIALAALPTLLSIVPLFGALFQLAALLIGIYGFYSYYLSLRAVHGLSAFRAAAVVIVVFAAMIISLALFAKGPA